VREGREGGREGGRVSEEVCHARRVREEGGHSISSKGKGGGGGGKKVRRRSRKRLSKSKIQRAQTKMICLQYCCFCFPFGFMCRDPVISPTFEAFTLHHTAPFYTLICY